MKPARTWILVADGARARYLENRGPGLGLAEREDLAQVGSRRLTRDIMADKPGRAYDSLGKGRHAMSSPTDPHKQQETDFIASVCDVLDAHVDEFEHLVVVAAPAALGDLRKRLSHRVSAKVVVQECHDLTRMSIGQIVSHLSQIEAIADRVHLFGHPVRAGR